MSRKDTVGIVGAGAFGTALAAVLGATGRRVVVWSRDATVIDALMAGRPNPRFAAAGSLPASVVATTDQRRLAAEARFLVLAVGSRDVRDRARELGAVLDGSHIVVHAVGALANDGARVSDLVGAGVATQKLGVLAGPALPADLVASGAASYSSLVVASRFDEVIAEARRLLNAPPELRVYSSRDFAGVELASALSGAYTVVLGLADGLGLGVGTRAVLVTRAVAEAARLVQAAGGEARTFAGLAGLGNLLVRSTGDRAPDYVLGRGLAEGRACDEESRTEGARAAVAGAQLAKAMKVRMPILAGLAGILSGALTVGDAARLVGETVAAEE